LFLPTPFADLDLPEPLLRAVEALGYTHPTPVQTYAIPVVQAGHDLAAEAQTGSGKTAAFALPILQKLLATPSPHPAVLVLAPTRELALQVAGSFKDLAKFAPCPPTVLGIIGGQDIEGQLSALDGGVAILVATPGRLLDLLAQDELDLRHIHTLVLDEADKLLDQGFSDELDTLLAALPAQRQTLLFSATLPDRVLTLAARAQRDPVTIRIDATVTPVKGIHQRLFEVPGDRRRMLLQHLFVTESWGQTLVFVATQRTTENVSAKLRAAGIPAGSLHGGLDQPDRLEALQRFKNGKTRVLVATDLAARGIDIPDLAVVVNFDLPRSPRDYVHRIGRTGRAGATGNAVSFIDHSSAPHFALIERQAGVQLERQQLPGFELTGEAPAALPGGAPVKGKRKSKKDKLREQAALASKD
jgi:ATP-dependent RNA helicase RhlE